MNEQSYFEIEYSIDKVSANISRTSDSDSDAQLKCEEDKETPQEHKRRLNLEKRVKPTKHECHYFTESSTDVFLWYSYIGIWSEELIAGK